MKLTGKPTTEQIAALLATPADPDEKIRERLRIELHQLVNHAALFGVAVPEPLPTEAEQIRACRGVMPYRIRQQLAGVAINENSDPYGKLRKFRGGVYRGD